MKNVLNICKNHIDQSFVYQRDPEIVLLDPATNVVVCSEKYSNYCMPLDPSKPMDQGHWNDDFVGDSFHIGSFHIKSCNYFDGELAFENLGNTWISNNRMKNLSPQELDRFIQSLSDDQLVGYCFRDPLNTVHDIDVHKYPELSRLEKFTIIMDNTKKNVSNMRNNLYDSHKKDIYDSVERLLENSRGRSHNDYPNVPMPLLNSYSQNYIMKNNCGS